MTDQKLDYLSIQVQEKNTGKLDTALYPWLTNTSYVQSTNVLNDQLTNWLVSHGPIDFSTSRICCLNDKLKKRIIDPWINFSKINKFAKHVAIWILVERFWFPLTGLKTKSPVDHLIERQTADKMTSWLNNWRINTLIHWLS